MRGPFVSQDFKDNDGTANHMHRQFRIKWWEFFTDVAGLPLRVKFFFDSVWQYIFH